MKVLGIITARGGSKGIPGKNKKILGGKPLLQYTIEAAKGSKFLDTIMLSTDDNEIAKLGENLGVEVPFIRPPELATDSAKSIDVLVHAVNSLEFQGRFHDVICLLQPTNPFRESQTIDKCLAALNENETDSAMTVLEIPAEHHPEWAYIKKEDGSLELYSGRKEPPPRRQMLCPSFFREGSVYVVRRDVLVNDHSLYGNKTRGVVVDALTSVNLDTFEDWSRAEKMVDELAQAEGKD